MHEIQGDHRLGLHVPRVGQELGHEWLQGELVDAGPLRVTGERKIPLEEKDELPPGTPSFT
jgi:hypothetical protein